MKKQNLTEQLSRIKQIMNENMNLAQDVTDLEIPMPTPQEVEAVVACEDDEIPVEHEKTFRLLKSKINQISDRNTLKQLFRDIRNAMRSKRKQQEEQVGAAAAVTVLGVPLSTVALAAIGLLLLIGILQRLFRRKEREYVPSCRQGSQSVRKEFGRKLL